MANRWPPYCERLALGAQTDITTTGFTTFLTLSVTPKLLSRFFVVAHADAQRIAGTGVLELRLAGPGINHVVPVNVSPNLRQSVGLAGVSNPVAGAATGNFTLAGRVVTGGDTLRIFVNFDGTFLQVAGFPADGESY